MTRQNMFTRSSPVVMVAFALALMAAPASAQSRDSIYKPLPNEPQIIETQAMSVRVAVVTKGLAHPWAMAWLPNGDILITERGSYPNVDKRPDRPPQLRIIRNGQLDPRPLGGVPEAATYQNKGLQDIVLHPRFAENKWVYFTYSKPWKPGENRLSTTALARARFEGGASLVDVKDIFVADAWTSEYSTSKIVFGPDGKIYMTVGMPMLGMIGSYEQAQQPGNHAGKVLRLNDDGSPPADNPFVGREGYRPELYALGIRSALGLFFHPTTGELWENENGPMGGDEINIIRAGLNYGWPVTSFGHSYGGGKTRGSSGPLQEQPFAPGMEQPLLFWEPSIAPSGMMLYTGDRFPLWKGNILVGALRGMQVQRIVLNARGLVASREQMLRELRQRIRGIWQGPDGLLYLLNDEDDGALLKIEPAPDRRSTKVVQ